MCFKDFFLPLFLKKVVTFRCLKQFPLVILYEHGLLGTEELFTNLFEKDSKNILESVVYFFMDAFSFLVDQISEDLLTYYVSTLYTSEKAVVHYRAAGIYRESDPHLILKGTLTSSK